MHFLVTNDDSIESPFLRPWVKALLNEGHRVTVAAPRTEQSWIGAAKSRHRPVTSECQDRGWGCETWVIDGTPSDCVNIALSHLLKDEPDAVLSGINIGMNASVGFIPASGTIGGAWEGALHGLPAVAASQDLDLAAFERVRLTFPELDSDLASVIQSSARHAAKLVPGLVAATPPRDFIVHNLNFPLPCPDVVEVVRTVPQPILTRGLFSKADETKTHRFVFQFGEEMDDPGLPLPTDRAVLRSGRISHTVLDYGKLGHP